MSSWLPTWLGGGPAPPVKTMKPVDAIRNQKLRKRFNQALDHTDPPASVKASEIAQTLKLEELREMGYETWKDVLPAVIEMAFEYRATGYVEIIKGGQVLPEDVSQFDIEGGIRVRRIDD